MPTQPPKIAIIGAGPVGLTLASILHRHGIQAPIFERDTSATVRAQGGTLDIHAESGQRAIVAAGLMDEFKRIARFEGDVARVITKDGVVLLDENIRGKHDEDDKKLEKTKEEEEEKEENDGRHGRPEIDRRDLKDLLLRSLPEGTVRWGKGVSGISPVEGTQQWTLSFLDSEDGDASDSGPYDLVLGADGTWSRVRPLLTDVRPVYAGISALDVWISADRLAARPDVVAFIGNGSVYMCAADRFLSMQKHGDGSARAYACVRTASEAGAGVPRDGFLLGLTASEEKEEVDWTDEKTRKMFLDRHYGDFTQEVRDVVLAMTEQPCMRHLYMLPVGHTWEPRPGVTLLGDAAHVMTPFAGVGVNVGMVDAMELAEGIVRYVEDGGEGKGLAQVLREYEEGMFGRSSKDAAFTAGMLEVEFRDDGCEAIVKVMSGGEGEVA